MRWQFADSKNEVEAKFRQDMVAKFDHFWNAFARSLDVIQSPERCAEWVSFNLADVDSRFMWELTPEVNGVRRFTITPENNYFLRPMVATMLERAPHLSGFRFTPFREPIPEKDRPGLLLGRVGQYITDVRFTAVANERNAIDLVFMSDAFTGENGEADRGYCFILCESALGQELLEEWIGNIETRTSKPNIIKRVQSFLGKGNIASETFPVDQLATQIEILKEQIVSKLRTEPQWKSEPELSERRGGAVITFERGKSRRETCSTVMPEVILSLSAAPGCFTSKRFSRCGEIFCYLKIDESAAVITDDSPDRGEMEQAFDKALRAASVGCVTGGGWGPVFNFIDFVLSDLEGAIPVLRRTSEELQLPKQTWLRFLDSELSQEWIGMYEDSPEPDMSRGW